MVMKMIPACLKFGIYEMSLSGTIIDRHECTVCNGAGCPYELTPAQPGICGQCFGTGLTPVNGAFDLSESVCTRCEGTGRIR